MNTTLWPVYIQGNGNVAADSFPVEDRPKKHNSSWKHNGSLHSVLQEVFEKWGQPWFALFTTRDNKQLDQLGSPFPDPEAYQTDALSFTWEDLRLICLSY